MNFAEGKEIYVFLIFDLKNGDFVVKFNWW